MSLTLFPSPHTYRPNNSTSIMMRQVLYALLPGILTYVWFLGWGVVINLLIASITALACEAAILWLRKRPVKPTLMDNSALVTAWLFALCLPPFIPWWMTIVGISFGIVFAKHLYGGLGYNPFNPAMVGYVVLLISFPLQMTHWPMVEGLGEYHTSFWDSVSIIFSGHPTGNLTLDALSGATPLDTMKTMLKQSYTVHEIKRNPLFGDFGGKGWEWIGNMYFLGGLWLIYKRVISWHIPVSLFGSLFILSGLFFLLDSDIQPSPLFHIFSGATILGAFFIATDPVTAATSTLGRLWYGAGIGVLIYVIRTWGGYPDGMAFSVLLMNMAAPTIDYYTQPRVFGH